MTQCTAARPRPGAALRSVAIGLVLLGCACGAGPSKPELVPQLDRILGNTRELAARAAAWDPDRALHDIGADPAHGTLHRFDDHLLDAVFETTDRPPAGDPRAVAVLDPEAGDEEANGVVAFAVDLPTEDVSDLELEIASPGVARVDIELRGGIAGEAVTIDLRTAGDDAPHTYRIGLEETFSSWSSKRLVGLRLRISMLPADAALEILRIVFLSPTAAFADAGYGLTHRRQGAETRRSIFQWSSSSLRLPVRIVAPVEALLEVGVAALSSNAPVRVEVTLRAGQGSRRLVSAAMTAGTDWTDQRFPLGVVEPGEYFVELRVISPQPTVVFWSNPSLVAPREAPLNVIIVLEDALRADHLSCYGYTRPTTPVKDAFAVGGVRFANCYAQATKTRFSCPSFMTSLYPTATGVEGIWHPHPSLHPRYVTLAEVLRRRGFETASIHQNANAGSPAGLDQGFSYLFENVPGRAEEIYTGLPLRWIERHRDRNFMLYLHLADPHEPYHPPDGFKTWFEDLETGRHEGGGPKLDRRDPRWMQEARRALYDGEIAANDHWFAAFLGRLQELGLADDTLLIFMSDHGEHLGEHGLWSHNPPSHRQVLHTPLIMSFPGRLPEGLVVDEIVQNLDIMPTVLELAGIDAGGLLLQGSSLVPLIDSAEGGPWGRDFGYAEEALLKKSRVDPRPYGSVFVGRWHLLDSLYAPMQLYDLDRDSSEELRLRSSRWLRSAMSTFLREMQLAELEIWRGVTRGEDSAVALDPRTISGLKALGYLE